MFISAEIRNMSNQNTIHVTEKNQLYKSDICYVIAVSVSGLLWVIIDNVIGIVPALGTGRF